MEAAGQNVSRADYPALFSLFQVKYGMGDGVTTFGLPDLRGEFLRGWDNNRGVDSGRSLGSSQSDVFKSHNHEYIRAGHGYGESTYGSFARGEQYGQLHSEFTGNHGGSETRPRNVSVMYCIKY